MGSTVVAAKSVVVALFRRLGYEVARVTPPVQAGQSHQVIQPEATYAPWNLDAAFLETYTAIRGHTLVDVYRCWELWTLVEQTRHLPGVILEVGVWRGGTGALIARKAQLCGLSCPVYLCDTFAGVVKAGERDTLYKGGEHADTSRAVVEELVHDTLRLDNVRILQGVFPDESAHALEGELVRLCHVDVDVYRSARDIHEWVWPRLAAGGMVVYDDYGFRHCEGITAFVGEQFGEPDRRVIHNLNGHAVIVKVPAPGPADDAGTAASAQ